MALDYEKIAETMAANGVTKSVPIGRVRFGFRALAPIVQERILGRLVIISQKAEAASCQTGKRLVYGIKGRHPDGVVSLESVPLTRKKSGWFIPDHMGRLRPIELKNERGPFFPKHGGRYFGTPGDAARASAWGQLSQRERKSMRSKSPDVFHLDLVEPLSYVVEPWPGPTVTGSDVADMARMAGITMPHVTRGARHV